MLFINNDEKLTELMKTYETETGKKAIWRGNITNSFKKWERGEKIYRVKKERICIFVKENIKNEWQEFAIKNNFNKISKLISESVKSYMNGKSKKIDYENLSKLTHDLKEPLTSIKGYSEILIENYKQELNFDVLIKLKNIHDQSIILEKKIDKLISDKDLKQEDCDILIVDDDLSIASLISEYFEQKGYKCEKVVDGTSALEFLETFKPKLILLDIILPDISGYEICKTIKSNKELKKIPIYYITAVLPAEVKKKAIKTGANGYFLKPFKFPEFDVLFDHLE